MTQVHKRRRVNPDDATVADKPSQPGHGRSWRALMQSPNAPLVLSIYLHVLLRIVIVTCVIVLILNAVRASHGEMKTRVAEKIQALEEEKLVCEQEYITNQCSIVSSPYLQHVCDAWKQDTCMKRDTRGIARTKIAAFALGELVNGLIEPLTLKAMIAAVLLTIGASAITNLHH